MKSEETKTLDASEKVWIADRFWERLEAVTKLSAVLAGMIYAAGFFIVSIDHARFGISEVGLFRPRIFTAGATFMLLVLVGGLSVFRTFGIFLKVRHPMAIIKWTPDTQSRANAFLILNLFSVVTGLAYTFAFILNPRRISADLDWIWAARSGLWFLLYGGSLFFVVGKSNLMLERPWSCVILAFLLNAERFIISFQEDRSVLLLSVFIYFSGLTAFYLYDEFKSASLRSLEFERLIPLAASLLIFYGTWVYGMILPIYGGGLPVSAILYLDRPIAGLPSGGTVAAIIEETDQGYYFLLKQNPDSRAIFVRRSDVAGVRFGTN
jgi:hypothetical protein